MFEDIDDITIQNANNLIKKVYNKIKINFDIEKAKAIVERDFDDAFVFEDFFYDFLTEHKDEKNFKDDMLGDIAQLIFVNDGNLTINELFEILSNPNPEPEPKASLFYSLSDSALNSRPPSGFEVVIDNEFSVPVEDYDTEKINKRIERKNKVDKIYKKH